MSIKAAKKTQREPVRGKDGIGDVYPDAFFLRIHAGEAKGEDGSEYELSVTAAGHMPLVRSGKTGRCFSIGWQELIRLAIAAGVDEPL
jgi:hypothetical protein